MIKNLPQIVLLNIVGLALFLSWYIPVNHGFWLPIDADTFYFFNQKLVESKAFLWLVALTNNRAFDGCSLLAMGMLMLSFWLKSIFPWQTTYRDYWSGHAINCSGIKPAGSGVNSCKTGQPNCGFYRY